MLVSFSASRCVSVSRTQGPHCLSHIPRAFTLVELLVVITIIGILIALLLPAVQAAREAARRLQCGNNIKQLALGCVNHESAHGFLPTGGWGNGWMGDPDQGFGKTQPGSWMLSVLPFIEQQGLFDMAAGSPGWPVPAAKKAKFTLLVQAPVSAYVCPSRRTAGPRRVRATSWFNADPPPVPPGAGSTDYAANSGSGTPVAFARVATTYLGATDSLWPSRSNWNGIAYPRSETRATDITDGTSNTYLLGEKYMYPDDYTTGMDYGDDDSCLTGYSFVQHRLANATYPPTQDTPGAQIYYAFGSAHSGGLNMAMCDGSVHTISYSIDLVIHERLGARNDGMPIETTKF